MAIVGIDLSLTSPAVAIYEDDVWSLFAFAQRNKEHMFTWSNKPFQLHLFPKIPEGTVVERYIYIIDDIMEIIPKHCTCVAMEAYAFPSREQAGHNFKLHELGGYLKIQLKKKGHIVHGVAVATWKKHIVGHGHATKKQICEFVTNNYDLDLLKILHLEINKKDKVPNPVEDLCDAICIAEYAKQMVTSLHF